MNVYFIGMAISMVLYIVAGFFISKRVRNANDFFVAGRNAPTILIVGSLVASYCSTGLFMGDAGEAYAGFFSPFMITVIMQTAGYLLGSVFFGRYLRRSEATTIPEFFGKRYESKKLQKLAAVTAIVTMLVYMLSVMQGIGTLMSYVTGLDYNLCILLALLTFTVLCFVSGSKGVLITDTIMFGIFTVSAVISVFVIVNKLGGWVPSIQAVTAENPDVFSWHGNLSHLYPTGAENMIWALMTGLTWVSVCAIGPWQSSRYLMAKNEHVVVRSAVYAAIGVGLLEFIIPTTAALLRQHSDAIPGSSYALIWAATNLLPTVLGVLLLTGVLAAGISSATTFLSLIGSSVAVDICGIEDDKKKLNVARVAIVAASAVTMLLAYFNPPQIYIVLLLSGTVVTCSWVPVCIASVWSKRVAKEGAFWGMLCGFVGCAAVKIVGSVFKLSLPLWCDSFVVGLVANVAAMLIATRLTTPTEGELLQREKLMVIPAKEFDAKEIRITKRTVSIFILWGGCGRPGASAGLGYPLYQRPVSQPAV